MSTSVEPDLLLDGDQLRDIVGLNCLCLRGQRSVQLVNVRLVVLLVVKLHDLLGDHRLQCLFFITELAYGYLKI